MDVKVHMGQGKLQHGGEDAGPNPHDLLAASLRACRAIPVLTRHIDYVGALDAAPPG